MSEIKSDEKLKDLLREYSIIKARNKRNYIYKLSHIVKPFLQMKALRLKYV